MNLLTSAQKHYTVSGGRVFGVLKYDSYGLLKLTLDSYVCQGQAKKKLVWQIRRSII